MLYFILIMISVIFIFSLNIPIALHNSFSIGTVFMYFFITVAFCGIVSFLIMLIIHRLPKKYFKPDLALFKTYKIEKRLYKIFKVKKWKDKVPELGKLEGFEKNKLKDPTNPRYLEEFLIDSCKSEAIHFLSAFLAIFIFFIVPKPFKILIALPVFIINFVCHIMPVIIQRYMRPRLLTIYEVSKSRKQNNILENEFDFEEEPKQNNAT